MEVMILLICFSLLAAIVFLVAFVWAVRNGQYDDMTTPAMRMLFETKKKQDIEKGQENL
ncbi:MAG: cbb3-type cytochrome oxidase assembly protein CcoS [Candidatus Zixiibacteriota bacterium]